MSQNGGAVDGARRNGATPRTPKAQQAPSAASTARTAAPTKEPEPGTGVGADASAGTSTGAITGNAGNRPLPPDPQLREEIADLLKDADFTCVHLHARCTSARDVLTCRVCSKLTLRQLRGLLVRKGFSQQDVHAQKKTIKAVVLTLLLVVRACMHACMARCAGLCAHCYRSRTCRRGQNRRSTALVWGLRSRCKRRTQVRSCARRARRARCGLHVADNAPWSVGAPVSELVHIITDKWRKASEEERRVRMQRRVAPWFAR